MNKEQEIAEVIEPCYEMGRKTGKKEREAEIIEIIEKYMKEDNIRGWMQVEGFMRDIIKQIKENKEYTEEEYIKDVEFLNNETMEERLKRTGLDKQIKENKEE